MTWICWFRNDLRCSDNPALSHAAEQGLVLPVFILDEGERSLGGASRWWLHQSLKALNKKLGQLTLLRGDPQTQLMDLVEATGAKGVVWNRCYEPYAVQRDAKIKQDLRELGIEAKSFAGSIIHEPWQVETKTGTPFKVYTPFWKAVQARGFPAPLPAPNVSLSQKFAGSCDLYDWGLLPASPNWAAGWEQLWKPGECGAQEMFTSFLEGGISGYGKLRDRPDLPNVSRLSPHIHFGEISPRQLLAGSAFAADEQPALAADVTKFQSEVAWRDFANHLMFHFPEITNRNWKTSFDHYPWRENAEDLKRWQQGMTGYPMVDAGMRELWHTGYMHNRVRMLAASFLVKHLRSHWKEGEAWFWDTLLDADLANNTVSWQWVTGSGADAAPYFRIFNPVTQGQKFDPLGKYIRKWCPELARLPDGLIHQPFNASKAELDVAGIKLGETYPLPMVDHAVARKAALEGYESVKSMS